LTESSRPKAARLSIGGSPAPFFRIAGGLADARPGL
jgi:hypothetical protein